MEVVGDMEANGTPDFQELAPLRTRGPSSSGRDAAAKSEMASVWKPSIKATVTYDIPGWVLVPAGRKGKLPGVVAIHCHSGRYVWGHEKIISSPTDSEALLEFRKSAYGRAYAEELARRGYVVFVIDGFYFGSRRLRPEKMNAADAPPPAARQSVAALSELTPSSTAWLSAVDRICSEFETLTAKTIFSTGATWPGILAWDDRRSVDYLCSRPEVDAKRIGCLGLSLVLQALLGGPRHGYAIAQRIRELSDAVLALGEKQNLHIAAAAPAEWVGNSGVGCFGEQSEGSILHAHFQRAETSANPNAGIRACR